MKKSFLTLIGLSLLIATVSCTGWNPRVDPSKVRYVDFFRPAPNQIINHPPTGFQPWMEIQLYGDIRISTFTRADDLQVEEFDGNQLHATYAGSSFFAACVYYPQTPPDAGDTSTDCVVATAGQPGSPRIILNIDTAIYSLLDDGHALKLEIIEGTSTPLQTRSGQDISPAYIDFLYRDYVLTGDGPYFIENFDLDGATSSIYPYGTAQTVHFFPPHGVISGTLSEMPANANAMMEPSNPEDLAFSGFIDYQHDDHLVWQCSSAQGFDLDTEYSAFFLSADTPFYNVYPLWPPTQNGDGEFLKCGPNCYDSGSVADTTGVEIRFHTSKVKINDFPLHRYTLRFNYDRSSSSMPLETSIGGKKSSDVADIQLSVATDVESPIYNVIVPLHPSESFSGTQFPLVPLALGVTAADVYVTAAAQHADQSSAGRDYVKYQYEPICDGDLTISMLSDGRVCGAFNDDPEGCSSHPAIPQSLESVLLFYKDHYETRNWETDTGHSECFLVTTPNSFYIRPGEKLFVAAIASSSPKVAYVSNSVTLANYPGTIINRPGLNFWADLDGDNEVKQADADLLDAALDTQVFMFPNVLPNNGQTGILTSEGSDEWLPTSYDLAEYNLVLNHSVALKDVPAYPINPQYCISSASCLETEIPIDGQTLFINVGGFVANVGTWVWTQFWDTAPGLGVNLAWSGPVTMKNVFFKELPTGTGGMFDPITDDLNGNGMQDCCYSSSTAMNCSVAANDCALATTWSLSASLSGGYAVGPNLQMPQIKNLSGSESAQSVTFDINIWMPLDSDPKWTHSVDFEIVVPKPVITTVGTMDFPLSPPPVFNGVRQTISGDFPEYSPSVPSVGNNQTVMLEIQSSDCYCNTLAVAPVNGQSFQTVEPIDFAEQCGIPPSLMHCNFMVSATGYDSLGYPSLRSDYVQFQIDPWSMTIPPIISYPVNNAVYDEQNQIESKVTGEASSLTTVDIYDSHNSCVPDCEEVDEEGRPGANCSDDLIATAIPGLDGYWQAAVNPEFSDKSYALYAMSYQIWACNVSDSVSFYKDSHPPTVEITSPDPWPVFVLTTFGDDYNAFVYDEHGNRTVERRNDGIPESTDAHASMLRLHRNYPVPSDFEIVGELYDANMVSYEFKLVNQIPIDPGPPAVYETFNFDSPACLYTGCKLPANLKDPDNPTRTIYESDLQDKFFHLIMRGQDLIHPPVEIEIPLVITRDPLVEFTVNQIEPSYPQDYVGENGSDAVPLISCTGQKFPPPPPNTPGYFTNYKLQVPSSGFDIDLWLSEYFINFIGAGLLGVKDAPGGAGVSPIPDDSLDIYASAAVTVTRFNGTSTTEYSLPASTDWTSGEHPMPFYDKIGVNGMITYNGALANYPIVRAEDIINFPVAHFPPPLPGQVNTVTLEGSVLLEDGDSNVYSYQMSPYHFDIGNWAVPDEGIYSVDESDKTWDDYMPFDHTQIIFECMNADRETAADLIGRDVIHLNGDPDPDGLSEDIFRTNPYFDVCNPDTYCMYPDGSQPDPIAGYKCAVSEWHMTTPDYSPDGTFHKFLRIIGLNSAAGENYLVQESRFSETEVTLNQRVRYMIGEQARYFNSAIFGLSINAENDSVSATYNSINVRIASTYDQLINELALAGLPTDPINRRNFYSIWIYPGEGDMPRDWAPESGGHWTMGLNINNRDLAFSMPKKINSCDADNDGIMEMNVGGGVNHLDTLYNQDLVMGWGDLSRVNHCHKIITGYTGGGLPIYLCPSDPPDPYYSDCSQQVPANRRYCFECDSYTDKWYDRNAYPFASFRKYNCFGETTTAYAIGEYPTIADEIAILDPNYVRPDNCDSTGLTPIQQRYCDLIKVIYTLAWGGGNHEWGHKFGLTATGPPPCGDFGCTTDGKYIPPWETCMISIHTQSARGGAPYFWDAMGGGDINFRDLGVGSYKPLDAAYLKHRVIWDDHTCRDRQYKFWDYNSEGTRTSRQLPYYPWLYIWPSQSDTLKNNRGYTNCFPNPTTITIP